MNWKIDFLKTLTDTAQGYVVECGWRCTTEQEQHSTGAYGTCSFPAPADANGDFIPYDKLTEDMVLGWVWSSGVDKAEVEANVARQLDALINPAQIIPPLPWAA